MQQTCQIQQDASCHMSSRVNDPVGPDQDCAYPCVTSRMCSSRLSEPASYLQAYRGAEKEGVGVEGDILEAVGPCARPALQHLPGALPSS